jgi:carbon monoxide dehydrogenase subunit G
MTVKVTVDINRKFTVDANIDTVFSLLSDVPASAAHFPKVHALTPLPDNSFRWEMEKVNLGMHSAQTAYACQYVANNDTKTIVWTPIKGEGNSVVSGEWQLKELESGTEILFNTQALLTLPLPGLLKLAISPLVKLEFSSMVDTYLRNLKGVLA